ncbi:MAG: serine hydrolase [Ignavibacteria bacterium]|nr:serine hydrolase [Ignavibacteria bacterium]
MRYPNRKWLQYRSPENAGWSGKKLSRAYDYYKKIGTDALLVIYKGVVLVSWGEVERRFLCHSVRKSLLSALIGIYENKGKIDLHDTLKSLRIDDKPPLSNHEKNARVIDLLKSRSGVYHTAQYEGTDVKPKRDSAKPGTKYVYNNWDFNALNTIYEKETGKKFFSAFRNEIAVPLQMEEFRLTDGYYHMEEGLSIHPAYPLRMSAKDLARFGLLYQRNGKWKGRQIIPADWVKQSTKAYSFDKYMKEAFGFMWFVSNNFAGKGKMFSSLGNGGQCLSVLPEKDLIIVHRVNTFAWKKVSHEERLTLFRMILSAKIGPVKKNCSLQELKSCHSERKDIYSGITENIKKSLINTYTSKEGKWKILKKGSTLVMTNNYGDQYKMLPVKENSYILEDSKRIVKVKYDKPGAVLKIVVNNYPMGNSILYPAKN